MRRLHYFLLKALLMISTMAFTQNLESSSWSFGLGTHAINYRSVNPIHDIFEIRDYSLLVPKVTISKRLNSFLSVDFQNSIGKIDNKRLKIKNQNFILSGIGLRYQFANGYLLPKDSWFDPYLRLSVNYGYYNYSELLGKKKLIIYNQNYSKSKEVILDREFSERNHNLVFNGGLGINFWIKPTLGINIESQYGYNYNKSYNTRSIDFLNHTISLIFRFGDNKDNKNYKLVNEEDDDFWNVLNVEDYKNLSKGDVSSISENNNSENLVKKNNEITNTCTNSCNNVIKVLENNCIYNKSKKNNKFDKNIINKCNQHIKNVRVFLPNSKKIKIKHYNQCFIPSDIIYLDDYIKRSNSSKYIKKRVKEFKKKCPKILFNLNQFKLNSKLKTVLRQVVSLMKSYPEYVFVVEGHTDNTGNSDKNKILSLDRSFSSFDFFEESGIPVNRIFVKGFGADRPIDSNSTKKGKRNNRRIEIKLGIYKQELVDIINKN